MNTFTVSTFIKRSPQEVFEYFTNPANSVKWQTGTESSAWSTEGPVGVGSIAHSVGKMLGREIVVDAEVTEWNPPNVFGQKASNGPLKFENVNKFESKDDGTLLVQTFQGEIGGLFKIAEGLAVKQLQKQVETDGQKLKSLLEAGQ